MGLILMAVDKMSHDLAQLYEEGHLPDRGPVTPEEAIQWLLDTGLLRAQRWEEQLKAWANMKPAERNATIALSMAERTSLRETAGLARRTGYHPAEQVQRFSELVMKALSAGIERSGLEEQIADNPWLDRALQDLYDGIVDTLQRAEGEARRAAGSPNGSRPEDIEGTAIDAPSERLGPYDDWDIRDLRNELTERGLKRGGNRATLIAKLRRDDGRPEDDAARDAEAARTAAAAKRRIEREEGINWIGDDDVIEGEAVDVDEPDEPDNG
jgi:hypothetical protein